MTIKVYISPKFGVSCSIKSEILYVHTGRLVAVSRKLAQAMQKEFHKIYGDLFSDEVTFPLSRSRSLPSLIMSATIDDETI